MNDTFTCDVCGRTFPKGWSDEERDAEAKKNGFDKFDPEDLITACDECYKKAMGEVS